MHILIIPTERYVTGDSPFGGIFQYQQARALHHAGIRVGIVAPAPLSFRHLKKEWRRHTPAIDVEEDDGIAVYRFQGWNWTTGKNARLYQWNFNHAGKKLFDRYVKERGTPDLIHAHNCLQAGLFAAVGLKKKNIPVILTEHSTMFARDRLNSWQVAHAALAWKSAERRLVVAPTLGALMDSLFKTSAHSWECVSNILDERFENTPLPGTVRHQHRPFRFLNIAMMEARKNQAILLRAFASAFRKTTHVELHIGGDGPFRQTLENLSHRLGIAERVHFLGSLDRSLVLREMQQCDAFVLSSDYETFGVVLIEAAACGKPLIAASGSGPDSIVHAKNGMLFPPRDIYALAAAMTDMAGQAARFDPDEIRKDCLDRFGSGPVAGKLISIYRRILSS